MAKPVIIMQGMEDTLKACRSMGMALFDGTHAIAKAYAERIARETPAKHAANPHPSGLWRTKGKQIAIPKSWQVVDNSFKDGKGNRYVSFKVAAPGGRSAYGKAASYAEYYTADKARQKKGKVLARELDKAFGMTGKAKGRVAWSIYERDLPRFDADVAALKAEIEQKYKEV